MVQYLEQKSLNRFEVFKNCFIPHFTILIFGTKVLNVLSIVEIQNEIQNFGNIKFWKRTAKIFIDTFIVRTFQNYLVETLKAWLHNFE